MDGYSGKVLLHAAGVLLGCPLKYMAKSVSGETEVQAGPVAGRRGNAVGRWEKGRKRDRNWSQQKKTRKATGLNGNAL